MSFSFHLTASSFLQVRRLCTVQTNKKHTVQNNKQIVQAFKLSHLIYVVPSNVFMFVLLFDLVWQVRS